MEDLTRSSEKTPRSSEESPTKLRTLAPKSLFTEGVEYIPLPKIPKKKSKSDQKHTIRPILPKPHIFGTKGSSPTKAAALMLKKKATLVCQRRSPVKILPKRPNLESLPAVPALSVSRVFTRSQGNKEAELHPLDSSPKQDGPPAKIAPSRVEHSVETEKAVQDNPVTIFPEEDCEDQAEKDEDQVQLDDLMAACTTIRYDPKKSSVTNQDGDTKSKSQKRREICLSMLEDDILETDPKVL
ncbi:hypothetical protein ElyMa_002999800 [Elysia marginata]|uniref:Uncharacterized protein n=1 Tax=Elysia marginata TaxID=1093978 RepID=A0AAV4ID78_9GAST|nr:hypothetical protein ElyMa_002999800 [Elysia marginata]